MTTPTRLRPTHLLLALAIAACGGEGPTSALPAGARLVVSLAEQPVEPGDVIAMRATLESPGRPPELLRAASLAWSVDRPGSARVVGDAVELLAADTVELRARHHDIEGTLRVVIPAAVVGRIAIAEPVVAGMLAGGEWPLRVDAGTRRGRALPAGVRPAWTTSDEAVVTVDAGGRLRARAAGTARVVAAGAGVADTVAVTVLAAGGDLALATPDTLWLEPGRVLRLRGAGLAAGAASATVQGLAAATTLEGDSVVRIVVPELAPAGQCVRPTMGALAVSVGTRRLTAEAPMRVPLRPALAAGAHAWVGDSIASGCDLRLPEGVWLVMPYRWDRAGFPRVADTVGLTLRLGDAPPPADGTAAAWRAYGAASPFVRPSRASAGSAATVRAMAQSTAPCRAPAFVGDSILRLTARDPDGRLGGTSLTSRYEWWHLVRRSDRLDVVVDTGFRRHHAGDSLTRANLDSALAVFDAEIAPALDAAWADPLPDRDANGGRIVMFVALASNAGPSAGGGAYSHAGCATGQLPGENFYIPGNRFSESTGQGTGIGAHAATLVHEGAHVHDLARRPAGTPGGMASPVIEGVATLITDVWMLADQGDTLGGNHHSGGRVISGVSLSLRCLTIRLETLPLSYDRVRWTLGGGYPTGCNAVSYGVMRGRARGRTLPQMMSALSLGARATYGDAIATLADLPADARRLSGEWMLSWYADELPGTAPELQQPMWRLRMGVEATRMPWTPTLRTSATSLALPLLLGEPDAKWVEVEVAAPGLRLSLDGVATLRARNGDVLLLRVR